MRKIVLLSFFIGLLTAHADLLGQDIPLFSQKLTNSFVFNPALAGHTFGSVTYSFKQNYSKVQGSPQNHFISIHAPIANHRFGIGGSFYQEDVTFLRNTYASAAFAYHLALNSLNTLSFGISAEYNSIGLNGTPNFTTTDQALTDMKGGRQSNYDFSFGMHYQNRFVKAGIAANRLSAGWIDKNNSAISYYYSGFVQGLIPLRAGEDLLEPYVAYQKLSETNSTLSGGLFYTYNNKITLGGVYRSGNVINGTLAFRLSKYVLLGYSREMIAGNVGGFVGSANEFTIRYDFNDQSYKARFRADYKSAVSYRRKTLAGPVRKSGSRNPKQIRRQQKKLAPFSPNKRYQNIKKLSVNSSRKKSFNTRKTKKPARRKPKKR